MTKKIGKVLRRITVIHLVLHLTLFVVLIAILFVKDKLGITIEVMEQMIELYGYYCIVNLCLLVINVLYLPFSFFKEKFEGGYATICIWVILLVESFHTLLMVSFMMW